jgi:hypothetical protein
VPARSPTINELHAELEDLRTRYPALRRDQLFVLWFYHAYLVDELDLAARAVTGGPGDRGVDGVLVDERSKTVYVVQGKLRERVNDRRNAGATSPRSPSSQDPCLGPRRISTRCVTASTRQ